jgi:hypothetical protein
MEPSSRTPEGEPNRCPICGKAVLIDPSRPPGDAPCPNCGHLLWFAPQESNIDERKPAKEESGTLEPVDLTRQRSDKEELARQEARLRQGEFTLDDFKKMLGQTKKLGPLNKIMSMIPGMSGLTKMLGDVDAEEQMRGQVGIIDSMTPDERRNPSKVIDRSRRHRIAAGAGVEPHEVNELVNQFNGIARMMKKMSGMSIRDRMRLRRGWHKG